MAEPKLRIKGHENENWEKKKLKNLVNYKTSSTTIKDAKDEGQYELYDVGKCVGYVDDSAFNKEYVSIVKDGDAGRTRALPKNSAITSTLGALVPRNNNDAYFIDGLLKNFDFTKFKMGTAIKHVYFSEYGEEEFDVPTEEEQRRIGALLKEMDKNISLKRKEIERLKQIKKASLSVMFPQEGETKPRLRFKGFTDDWEQRELLEIAEKVTEKNKSNEFSEPFTNSAELGIISQKDYFDREIVNDENLDGYYIVRNDDFIYNPRISVSAPVGPINRNRLGRNGVMSPLYTVFRTHDIDNLYLEFYFKTTNWHKFMKLNGDSGARFDRFTISSALFMKMPIPYPDIEEQRKIGEYFDTLDQTITLHQRELKKLENIKAAMLRQMFPKTSA